jgi:hypothetical protein
LGDPELGTTVERWLNDNRRGSIEGVDARLFLRTNTLLRLADQAWLIRQEMKRIGLNCMRDCAWSQFSSSSH